MLERLINFLRKEVRYPYRCYLFGAEVWKYRAKYLTDSSLAIRIFKYKTVRQSF